MGATLGGICIVITLCLVTGCGGPRYVHVEGTVTLDGKPLAYKSLVFIPEPGTRGNGAGGYTNGEGKYSLNAIAYGLTRDQDGVQSGRYRVTVSEPIIPISEADFERAPGGEEDPAAAGMIIDPESRSREIPAEYSSAETTPLVLEVPDSGGTLDVKLKSSP